VEPIDPINYQEGVCADFSVFEDNQEMGADFVLSDMQFSALGSELVPFINDSGDGPGLQFDPAGIRIKFPMPTSVVSIRAASYNAPLQIAALDANESPLVEQEVLPNQGITSRVLSSPEIVAVDVTGGGFEGLLVEICTHPDGQHISDVEVFIPYPQTIDPPVGDAQLVPGYEPMREAVQQFAPQLQEAGVQINTARTVILGEEEVALQQASSIYQETVILAPTASSDLNFGNLRLAALSEQGTIIGLLILETNVPDSPLLSGPYLVVAYHTTEGEAEREGIVQFVDVEGQAQWEMPLFSAFMQENFVPIPIAAIYLGTKYCVSCDNGWCNCYPCSLWQILLGQGSSSCPRRLGR
jgi:hypothetical protein